jgi:PAS domain S-box-containing protein
MSDGRGIPRPADHDALAMGTPQRTGSRNDLSSLDSLNAQLQKEITGREQADIALSESEERYRTLFASAPVAVFACDRNAVIQDYNQRAAELWGREPKCGVEQHCGSVKLWLPDGTFLPHVQSPMVEVLRTGIPAHNVEVFIERPDGSRLPVLVNFSALKNARGEITGAVTSIVDISERKRAEEALRESEDRFRAIAENIPQLAWIADGEGYVDWFNRGWLEYTGTTLQENQGVGWKAVHHPDHLNAVAEKFERHLREGRDWEDTFPLRGKDGNYRWFLSRMNVIRDESGKVIRFFGTNTDITDERKAEERQRLLIGELAHRGGNLLAVIQSIVNRSLSGTRPLADEREALTRRIQALARTQSALVNEGFGTPVADIIRLEFEAFSNRVIAVGPDVMLNSRTAQTFALLVHELATNATKYGALSLPKKGRIDIHWLIEGAGEEARFKFEWQERDGPPVVPPTHQGFGSLLFEKVAAQDFGVPPKILFAPGGLIYEIDAPLSVVVAGLTVPPTPLADGAVD